MSTVILRHPTCECDQYGPFMSDAAFRKKNQPIRPMLDLSLITSQWNAHHSQVIHATHWMKFKTRV